MTKTFINYSNHPSCTWSPKMIQAAKEFGEIVDISFAPVDPSFSTDDVISLAAETVQEIESRFPVPEDTAIMLQGEMTLTFRMVAMLQAKGYRCLASTSERLSTIDADGNRVTRFEFTRFREY